MNPVLGNHSIIKHGNAVDVFTDDESIEKKACEVEEIKEDLPNLNITETNSGSQWSGEQLLKIKEESHFNSISPIEDTNSGCIDRLLINHTTVVRSQAETIRFFLHLKKVSEQMDKDILNEIIETEKLGASILKIEEEIDDMEWKLKMDEPEIELLEHESLVQVSELEKVKGNCAVIFKKRTSSAEMKNSNKSRAETLAITLQWIKDLMTKKDEIKEVNDHK